MLPQQNKPTVATPISASHKPSRRIIGAALHEATSRDGCNRYQQLKTQRGQLSHTTQCSDEAVTVTVGTSASHVKPNDSRNYKGSVSCISGSVPQSPPRL